jgi:hypothetical protein
MAELAFAKGVVGRLENDTPPAQMNTFLAVGDINGDGLPDLAVCGRSGVRVWLENVGTPTGWVKHLVENVDKRECGGLLYDLTGSGPPGIVGKLFDAQRHIDVWSNANAGSWRVQGDENEQKGNRTTWFSSPHHLRR